MLGVVVFMTSCVKISTMSARRRSTSNKLDVNYNIYIVAVTIYS